MNPAEKKLADLEAIITKLQSQVNDLSTQVYKNNFSSNQTFNKDSIFLTRLKVPHYTVAPTVSEVGDLIEVGGILYICTVAGGTFTKVGSQ